MKKFLVILAVAVSGFVFGQQRYDFWGRETGYNIATTSANNGWLVQNQDLNKNMFL
jgi:hypothetical protein